MEAAIAPAPAADRAAGRQVGSGWARRALRGVAPLRQGGLGVGLLVMGLGCASAATGQQPPALAGMQVPDWVGRASGAHQADAQKVFYGVGSVHGIHNLSLARSTADNRARAEIAKIFTTYSASLMEDFSAASSSEPGTEGDGPAVGMARGPTSAPELQDVEQAIKTFSAAQLVGVQIVDHWFHPSDGSVYALARLDLDRVVEGIGQMGEVGPRLRAYVRSHAEAAFARLQAAEAAPPPAVPEDGEAP